MGRHRARSAHPAVRRTGGVMLAAGALLLSWAGYEVWGTSLGTARAQTALRAQLKVHGFPGRPIPGGAVGFIRIPSVALDAAFVQGTTPADLARGPGHYPQTPLPGSAGNVAIAGHRTTHGAPFWALDRLRPGDRIELRTGEGKFVYAVRWTAVFPADDWGAVLERTAQPSLTLTTCFPRFTSRQRLVVRGDLVYGRVPGGFIDRPGRPAPG